MKSELLLALPIGIGIGLLIFHLFSAQITILLAPLTSALTPIVNSPTIANILTFVNQNKQLVTTGLGIVGSLVSSGLVWNYLHKIGMQKQELASTQKLSEVKTQASNAVTTLQQKYDNATEKLEIYEQNDKDTTRLLNQISDLKSALKGVETERDKALERAAGGGHVANQVRKVLEDAKKVP